MSNVTKPDFQQVQHTFTQHMRDPERYPAPDDVEDRRMAIYRRLFFNNVCSFLGNSFPVLRKIYDTESWEKLIREYFSHHVAHTPLFPRMPGEFVQYLQTEREPQAHDPDYLAELAHYEWVGMSLRFDGREIDNLQYESQGDVMQDIPCLNPLVELLQYRYAVHEIAPENLPTAVPEQPTYLAVYRDPEDSVGFMVLNPVSARLLDLILHNTDHTGEQLLAAIAEELQHPKPEVVIEGGRGILAQLREKGVILGTVAP